ncbi:MAG: c-type cytochrome domain-containing protein, partial [Verrucomicrobiota bacterium]
MRLDSPGALLAGGESGKVVVPGRPKESLLIKAVEYEDADLQMPPKKKLSDRQVADLIKWVKLGAPWPEAEKNQAQRPNRAAFEITEEDRTYWAFQPIKRSLL